MFNLGALASSVLESLDNVAKETLEEPKISATALRSKRKPDTKLSSSSIDSNEADLSTPTSNQVEPKEILNDDTSINSTKTQESFVLPPSPRLNGSKHGSEDSFVQLPQPNQSIPSTLPSTGSIQSLSSLMGKKLIPPTDSSTNDSELKKILKKKNQEIESLNRECLELEEQINSLKQEVQEAWDNYKQAQEKAASRETELVEEITLLEQSQVSNKQDLDSQMIALKEEVNVLSTQYQLQYNEKLELQQSLANEKEEQNNLNQIISKLRSELDDAKLNTLQGVKTIQDELIHTKQQNEQIRHDYNALLKQNQVRFQELEKQNNELVSAIGSYQQEIQQYKAIIGNENYKGTFPSGSSNNMQNSLETLEKENVKFSYQINQQEEKIEGLLISLKNVEQENRLLSMQLSQEKEFSQQKQTKLSQQIQELQEEKNQLLANQGNSQSATILRTPSVNDQDMQELKNQIEHLSKLLLKKQANVLELQSERSALKTRVTDLQARCSLAEKRLSDLKDVEDEGFIIDDDSSPSSSNPSNSINSSRLSQRKVTQRSSRNKIESSTKVLNDLEKYGVKPGEGVRQAVSFIDSWAILTGRLLRSHPLARVGFVIYLLILHLWVLFILVIQTHSLDIQEDSREKFLNK